ncbi:MAG: hypothetical protein QOF02_715 [Blastocatellia bacterium]|jgi:uncharacterized protein|nr:hypothetical protein [Blastocatellia bacterium]
MRIEVEQLEGGGKPFEHRYEPEELILDEERARLTEAPQVRGVASRRGEEARLRGSVTARAEVDCDRCLKSVAVPIETEFDLTYIPASIYVEQETAELQEADLLVSVYEGGAIDVDEIVREQILLALPEQVLCREECHGLCPVCGTDRNIGGCACEEKVVDPRWAALKDL